MNIQTNKLIFMSSLCWLGLVACSNPNSAQDAGKHIDQAVANAETRIDSAKDSISEKSDEVQTKLSDTEITTKVKAAFLAESSIASMDIQVNTKEGVVILTGVANSQASSEKAAEIANVISEVRRVDNFIKVI